MTLEIEASTASVIAYILRHIPTEWQPIYEAVPEGFMRPTVYFPVPETEWEPQTLRDYKRVYVMYVVFFGDTIRQAQEAAGSADMAIKAMRGVVPLLDKYGKPAGYPVRMRMRDQRTRVLDANEATVQLALTWWMPVQYFERTPTLIQQFNFDLYRKEADRD